MSVSYANGKTRVQHTVSLVCRRTTLWQSTVINLFGEPSEILGTNAGGSVVTDNDLRWAANWDLPRRWPHVHGRVGSFHDTWSCGSGSSNPFGLRRSPVVHSPLESARWETSTTDCKRARTDQTGLRTCKVGGTHYKWIGFYFIPVLSRDKKTSTTTNNTILLQLTLRI